MALANDNTFCFNKNFSPWCPVAKLAFCTTLDMMAPIDWLEDTMILLRSALKSAEEC